MDSVGVMIRRSQAWMAPQGSGCIIQGQFRHLQASRRQSKQDLKRSLLEQLRSSARLTFLSPSEGTRTPNLVDLLLSLRLDGLVPVWCPLGVQKV
jgi:hypothetical protein